MPSANDLDAVTVDAMGTLVELHEPAERLHGALLARGLAPSLQEVAEAFRQEVAYYLEHKLSAKDPESLLRLRHECARVFLEAAGADIGPAEFCPAFVEAMVFRPLPGAAPALALLRGAGLSLACVSDWDVGLSEQLAKAGLDHWFDVVLTSAEAGAAKPSPALFCEALSRLGTAPERTVHVGDGEADREGALAAGLAFELVPLATVPERLGVR